MPNKKKTRRQKMIADTRRKTSASTYTFTAEKNPSKQKDQQADSISQPDQNYTAKVDTSPYQYIYKDLLKTSLVTLAILGLQGLIRIFFIK